MDERRKFSSPSRRTQRGVKVGPSPWRKSSSTFPMTGVALTWKSLAGQQGPARHSLQGSE